MGGSEGKQSFEQAERLCEQYGKPLEAEHWGRYLAIHPDGRITDGRIVLDTDQGDTDHGRRVIVNP